MVVGLSYMGDIRMGLAEDSKKVDRIATSSSAGLQDIYLPMLRVLDILPTLKAPISLTSTPVHALPDDFHETSQPFPW